MNRTVSYLIVIERTPEGYIATAPAFPEMRGVGSSVRVAYARLKSLLKARLLYLLADGQAPPREPVVQTRTIRIDLWYLQQEVDLR